ncbi:MAG TPA: TonB family protein [Candidatus Acidoferrales bacterium]|nr:TonB family protein [Candidatus Acidoferrales bacterium]
MLVPRILVPDDAVPAPTSGGRELPRLAPGSEGKELRTPFVRRVLIPADAIPAPAAGTGKLRGGVPSDVRLFAEVMLEKSSTRPPRRLPKVVISLVVHGLLLVALVLAPLYFTQAIDIHQFNETLLVAPPAAPPPPPPPAVAAVARPAATLRKVLPVPGRLMAPRVVPKQVAAVSDASGGPDLMAGLTGGVPGGVPGGQSGGVLGGILGGTGTGIPAAPEVAAPRAPVRVGGAVKAPRLLLRVEPTYPVLARQAKLQGDVVVDAVIDEHGNVASMHVLSGSPLLIQAAMDALRHWRYEPTTVDGQPIPVELTVTLTFRLT